MASAAQPIATQQAALDAINAQIAREGRSPALDKRREQPVFLSPGDSLTFERIDRRSFDRIAREVEAGTFDWSNLVKGK